MAAGQAGAHGSAWRGWRRRDSCRHTHGRGRPSCVDGRTALFACVRAPPHEPSHSGYAPSHSGFSARSHRRRATDRACRCSRSGWRGLSAMGSRSHLPKVRATGGVARRQSTFGRAPSAPPRRTCLSTGAIREARGQVAQESSRPRRTHGGGGAQNYNMVRRNGTGRAAATGFGRYTDGTRTFPRAGFGSRIRCNVGGGVRGGGSVTRSPRASDRRELMEGLRAALVAPRIAWGYHGA